jgi:hypothetical protein
MSAFLAARSPATAKTCHEETARVGIARQQSKRSSSSGQNAGLDPPPPLNREIASSVAVGIRVVVRPEAPRSSPPLRDHQLCARAFHRLERLAVGDSDRD